MDTALKTLTSDRLQTLAEETESTLSELRAELERRDEISQHHEVDNLERHMSAAEANLRSIRDFIAYLAESKKAKH